MRTALRTSLLAVSLAVLAACGGETTSPLTDGTPAPTEGTTTDGAAASSEDASSNDVSSAAGSSEVAIDDFDYAPASITVTAGTEVTWTNADAALHSVTAGTPEAPEPETFDLDDIDEQGETVSHTFDEPGTYAYFCRYHDFMTGTVEVTG